MNPKNIVFVACVILILVAGCFLRVHHTSAFDRWTTASPQSARSMVPSMAAPASGYDEAIYSRYLGALQWVGVGNYRQIVLAYEESQNETKEALVHPLRMTYIVLSYGWMEAFHCKPLVALHAVASLAGILHLFVAGIFAWRVGGKTAFLGVLALMAFAPLQLCLSQRALVDGVYAFGATLCFWLLWENLRAPNRWGWLAAYTLALFITVMTKEYAAFVVFAFCAIMLVNRWLDFGVVTPKLLAATVIGPALAVLLLMYFAGGVTAFFNLYFAVIKKSSVMDYAVKMQDGPWSRYILDFLIVSPAVLLLAVGRVFQLDSKNRPDLYCAAFILFSYIPMASVHYGMSLRFAAFWDLPLCWLAFSLLNTLVEKFFASRKMPALVLATVLVCGIELREYSRIFVQAVAPFPVYDPITRNLLQADKILK